MTMKINLCAERIKAKPMKMVAAAKEKQKIKKIKRN